MRSLYYTALNQLLARTLNTPPYIILFVSDNCPNNCLHCWYNINWKKENLKKEVLTNDELIKISENLKSVSFLSITGGEAFLRDGIEEIVYAFSKNTKVGRFDIPTSGFNPDLITTRTEKILRNLGGKPLRIDISLDGTENTHNNIRQNQNAYRNAIQSISGLKILQKKFSNLDISIITTISEHNFSEIEQIAKLTEEFLPNGEWMVNIERGNNTESIVNSEVIDSYKKAGLLISERISGNRFSGDKAHKLGKWLTAKNIARRDIITDILRNNWKGGGCAAGTLAGVIFNDGDVRPCETLNTSFGNLRDYDYNLGKVWNNANAVEGRKSIQNSRCCCTHECFLSVSMLIQPACIARIVSGRLSLK